MAGAINMTLKRKFGYTIIQRITTCNDIICNIFEKVNNLTSFSLSIFSKKPLEFLLQEPTVMFETKIQ